MAGERAPRSVTPGRGVAFQLAAADGHTVRVVLLSAADSLALWKTTWAGRDRAFLTKAGLVVDGATVRLSSSDRADLTVGVYPAPADFAAGKTDGLFTRCAPELSPATTPVATVPELQPAGRPRDIPLGKISQPVAMEPTDADFDGATVWRIALPADLDLGTDPLLRLHYTGDVARVTLNGRLLEDDFYNGRVFELGLRRHAPEILQGELRVAILPLRKDAITGASPRIFLADSARPHFGSAPAVATLDRVEIIPRYEASLTAGEKP